MFRGQTRRGLSYVPPKAARSELAWASPPNSPAFLLRDPPALFFGGAEVTEKGASPASPQQQQMWAQQVLLQHQQNNAGGVEGPLALPSSMDHADDQQQQLKSPQRKVSRRQCAV